MRINRQDTNGVKPLLQVGELGYDNYPGGGDAGRVFVGTGTVNIALAKKSEVLTVDSKTDAHIARTDNPHSTTKAQVGLGNVDNTSDSSKVVASASKWTTGRTINGTVVDGTVDVTTAKWGEARDVTIGNAVKSVNGSSNVVWTLNEIGAIGTDSPAFTGTPTGPTALVTTSTSQLATTAFVNAEIANDAIPRVTSTDNAIVRFDGTTGAVQNSGVIIDDNGNLNITRTGTRITGDFTNGTDGNRLSFETSILNSSTVVNSFPNGTGILSAFRAFNTAQGLNSSFTEVYCDQTQSMIMAGRTGTGTYQPMTFNVNGVEKMRIDTSGNVLVTGGGGLGYGTGSGGVVTQLTSKSTAVTLNKPNGLIILNNAALAANTGIGFTLNNSLINANDRVYPEIFDGNGGLGINYNCWMAWVGNGSAVVIIKNVSNSTLSDTISIKFTVIKGAIS